MAARLETDSLITPRVVPQQDSLPGARDSRCSPCKGILYFTGTVASLGAIGIGIYNIAVEPSQVMATITKYALPVVGGLLLASVAKNMGDLFKQKEVVVVGFPLEGKSSGDEIVIERRTLLRLIEKVARNNNIVIPSKRIQETGPALNEAINERLDSIHKALATAGMVMSNYTTLNHMLDQILAAYQLQRNGVDHFPIDQQATIKLRVLEQALQQNGQNSDYDQM